MFLNGILVVEGKEDASYLSNYISSEIVATNGFEISEATLAYLKSKKTIILTDPDEAGEIIRNKLNSVLTNASNVEIDINYCTKGTKKGVAECEINEILTKLKPFKSEKIQIESNITLSDLYNIGLVGDKKLREKICEKLNIGKCNVKTMYKRMLSNNIKIEQLYDLIK